MSNSMTFSVMSMILNILGVCPVGFLTGVTSWFDATSMALVALLGDLHSAIAAECNVVCFLTLFSYLNYFA